ncbi:Inositol polyphosphate-related phosphatase [Metarhizium album ARSEF 1941]|uniref:Inositol polyphosphate-related phosphatase n=1 Tax=Metarhizium album (strain ARSEF 1941) TaxID=1081103 RepID=A0A0B2WNR4_METAS|nr:Inositol polyphosphate-related phosphatase [Metarhizium album ARSEF 1941]KHN95633.1 Inositol polyphosphate-related phosphatase [Metarhizium album ARSEF 1941]
MEPPRNDGPDGSSIKPVSSLLARFENLSQSAPLAPPQNAPSRSISPAPKPDRLRTFKASQDPAPSPSPAPVVSSPHAAASQKTPVKPPAKPIQLHATEQTTPRNGVPALANMSTTPAMAGGTLPSTPTMPPPPALKVLPPQSPTQTHASAVVSADQSPFLDPTTAASHELTGASPIPIKIPSRPLTPMYSLSAPRSPRLAPSQPPSPPPPRRSVETRREPKQPPPPPAPRLDKSRKMTPVSSNLPDTRKNTLSCTGASIVDETSPFNSPPASPEKTHDDESPPELPMRPRAEVNMDLASRSRPVMGASFEPPPVHHSLAVRRSERDASVDGTPRPSLTTQRPVDGRVAHSPKRSTSDLTTVTHATYSYNSGRPPPKPPRPAQQRTGTTSDTLSSSAPAGRSQQQSPPTTHHFPAPPTRIHAPVKTVDRPTDRETLDSRALTPSPPSISASRPTPRSISPPPATSTEPAVHVTAFPDCANVNRKPPHAKKGCYEIQTKYDPRIIDICGDLVCTSGQLTRIWNTLDGEQIMSLAHTEGVRATAVLFKPAADADHEGAFIWVGTNIGELMEVEVATQRITEVRTGVHGKAEITKIYRHYNQLWSLDEGGILILWPGESDGVPNLRSHPIIQPSRLPKGATFSMVVGSELWHATGKSIRVFEPSTDGSRPFQVLVRPLTADGCGDVSAGTILSSTPGKVYFGHVDGKVSIFSSSDYSCQMILNVSSWKINGLAGVGHNLWAAYNTGKICVYDTTRQPWTLKKEWQAHDQSVLKMRMDPSAAYRVDRLQVVSLGTDSKVKLWDGMLQDTWLEDDLKSKDINYCEFEEIKAMVLTWNAGASTPHSLRYSKGDGDATFFQDLLRSSGSPDILIFGFQELVDLEDKTATAKRLLKSKKKEGTEQEHMSHQYRDWRDFLLKTLDDYMPGDHLYHLLQSSPLVGLFTCVFVKSTIRDRIRNLNAAEVKRGMGGLHGNKGAIAVRFRVDDTSLCFINCHLAAGQSQANSRHNDIAAILEANLFPTELDPETRLDTFTGGGDGSMILDHELCILNGDLNYRIDTMSRDTVVKAVRQQQLAKLLDRDQLLVARRRNAAFRLRAFEELPISFSPTYKYDVGTDTYDTSEKRRSPAWCDRLLFRGQGRVRQLDYKRHEVRASDHRPVTGSFRLWVKKIDAAGRAKAWMESQGRFESVRAQVMANEIMTYLTHFCGFDEPTSQALIKETLSRKVHRSPSRNRGGGY